jgi:hypothetical protein
MRYDLIGQLPHHQYVHVDTAFTHRAPEVVNPHELFNAEVEPSRMPSRERRREAVRAGGDDQ